MMESKEDSPEMYKKASFNCKGLESITEVTYKGITGSVLPFTEENKYLQIYKNGVFLTEDEDYIVDMTKITFINKVTFSETDLIKLVYFK